MIRRVEPPGPASPESRQDARHYGWVFFALSLSNGLLGYLDAQDNLTTRWDDWSFPLIMGLYFVASVVVTVRPRWIEPTFLMALFPTTIYQVGIVYLSIHGADAASYYSAASGTSYFPFLYVGLFIVSARRATLYSTLHFGAFCLLAVYNWISLHGIPVTPLRTQSEHLFNAILLSHPIYILALRYIVRLRERLHATQQTIFENKATFLSMLSHEIRNQLQTIVIAIDLLDMRLRKPENRKSLRRLHASTEQLQVYLRDVNELTKLENPSLMFEYEPFSPHELLLDIGDEWTARAEAKGIELLVASPPGPQAGANFSSDRARLRQIVSNLLSNALKFTRFGRVDVRLSTIVGGVRLEVRDTGIGIPEDAQARIFQPFTQADNSDTRRHGGTGLGLSITKRLAQLMGGTVGVVSRPGTGSTFWLTVRFEPAAPVESAPASKPQPAKEIARRHRGTKVLVVDDDPLNREVACLLLKEAEITPEVASNGQEAVEHIQRNNVALILMDMQMPVLDGMSATRAIRSRQGMSRTPILAMTANAFDEDRERCFAAGMDDHLGKPLEPDGFLEKVLYWLDKRMDATR
mgnify:CR=1 FL=1